MPDGGTLSPPESRILTVEPGDGSDVCPLCGIHRMNAGFLKETCGDGYLKPECFVKELTKE